MLRALFKPKNALRGMQAIPGANYEPIEDVSQVSYGDQISNHRTILPIYDLEPIIKDNYVAPNATVAGEVFLQRYSSVWYNAVIRGDLNKVTILEYSSIGDGTVIQTVASLPTGLSAGVHIGKSVTIHANCSLTSCHIENDVVIGAGSTVMEGARIEKGAMLAPGTVVPPGRLVPSNTLWAGNPCEYVKDLDIGELWANYTLSFTNSHMADVTKGEFLLWGNAYLKKDSTQEDIYPEGSFKPGNSFDILHDGRVKTYL